MHCALIKKMDIDSLLNANSGGVNGIASPPDALLALFKKDIATDHFVELPSSLKVWGGR
jgi:hypothetical protein